MPSFLYYFKRKERITTTTIKPNLNKKTHSLKMRLKKFKHFQWKNLCTNHWLLCSAMQDYAPECSLASLWWGATLFYPHLVSDLSSNSAISSFRTKQWWRLCLVETATWTCRPRTRTAWWCWEPPGWGKVPLSHASSTAALRISTLPPSRIFIARSTTYGETCISWTSWTPLGITLSLPWGGFPS